jgi:hypothetical protein
MWIIKDTYKDQYKEQRMNVGKEPRGLPFKSKLRPYVDQIRKWRRAGFTWIKIAQKLEDQGCKTHAANLCQFMRRYRKRPFPSGAEPEVNHPVPVAPKPVKRVVLQDSSTPYFEQLVDEAHEAARAIEERPVFNVIKPTRPL